MASPLTDKVTRTGPRCQARTTGAVESGATTLTEVIKEMLLTRTSERQGRMIDHDSSASMEKKKQEGYF